MPDAGHGYAHMWRRVKSPRDAGLSLVELMVAVVILSIAVIGLFHVFDQAALAAGSDRDRLLAGLIARNRAEELQLGLPDLPAAVRLAGRDWDISTRAESTVGGFEQIEITVRPRPASAGARLVTYLRPGGGA